MYEIYIYINLYIYIDSIKFKSQNQKKKKEWKEETGLNDDISGSDDEETLWPTLMSFPLYSSWRKPQSRHGLYRDSFYHPRVI